METELRTVRHKMLRIMCCILRRPEKMWIEYIKRATAEAEISMLHLDYAYWLPSYRRRKWRLAAKQHRLKTAVGQNACSDDNLTFDACRTGW